MTTLPKAIYRFNAIPIKLPRTFFHRTRTKYFKVCLEAQKTQNSQRHSENEKWSWRHQAPELQTILQAAVVKTVWYWHKDRNTDQWERIETPELNPHTYSQLIYDIGGKNIQRRKDSPSISASGKTGQPCVKE